MKDDHKMHVALNAENNKPFKFMKVWEKIKGCQKWKSWRLTAAGKGAQQTREAYWKRIKDDFDERKAYQKHDYLPECNVKGCENRWAILQGLCNKFHGCRDQVWMRNESGKSDDLKVKFFQIVVELLFFYFSCIL